MIGFGFGRNGAACTGPCGRWVLWWVSNLRSAQGQRSRPMNLSRRFVDRLAFHIATQYLAREGVFFSAYALPSRPERPDPATLGLTRPDAKGRRHRHATTIAYGEGCRCAHCDGYLSASGIRAQVWLRALEYEKVGARPRARPVLRPRLLAAWPTGRTSRS